MHVGVRVTRKAVVPGGGHHGQWRPLSVLVTVVTLSALWAGPALAATAPTSESNKATLNLAPAALRSITVTPATSTFGDCTAGGGKGTNTTPGELAFPNGICTVGSVTTNGITGGVTVVNGPVAGHIDVSGQQARPEDTGTPWTLIVTGTPGVDQFREATNGSQLVQFPSESRIVPQTIPVCDKSFEVSGTAGACTSAAGQSATESLVLLGPSATTDTHGPFVVTTTWMAVP